MSASQFLSREALIDTFLDTESCSLRAKNAKVRARKNNICYNEGGYAFQHIGPYNFWRKLMASLESEFQQNLVKKLRKMFPDCEILKNNPNYLQGVPDLIILWYDRYALLEVKRSYAEAFEKNARPNQLYYVEKFNAWSFSAFIYPENEEEVLYALQRSFQNRR